MSIKLTLEPFLKNYSNWGDTRLATTALVANTMANSIQAVHSAYAGRCPDYITDCVRSVADSASRSGLRSAKSSSYATPRLRTKLGERAFSFAGPAAWNSLPAELRGIDEPTIFRKNLKTHFFNLAFP